MNFRFDVDDQVEKASLTRFRRLAVSEVEADLGERTRACYSLVLVWPETGRTHQIRRHFRQLRHPLIGDTKYGDAVHNRFFRERFGMYRLLLHAWHISFCHPLSGEPLDLTAELPPDMGRLVEALGWGAVLAEAYSRLSSNRWAFS